MKKTLIFAAIALALAAAATMFKALNSTGFTDIFSGSVNALTRGEGANVTCRCNRFVWSTCKSSNKGSTCAGGENVHCWDYDGNC